MEHNSSSSGGLNWFLCLIGLGLALCLLAGWRDWGRSWRLWRSEWEAVREECLFLWGVGPHPPDKIEPDNVESWCESFESDRVALEPLDAVMEQVGQGCDCAAMSAGARWN